MSGEDRVFMQWADGSFITLTDPDLILLVRKLGTPETLEFRAHDEGYVTITHDLEDDDPDDIRGQLDRLVDKGELTRAAADAYLRVNQGGEY
tara:strand:- start:253 stop:528 length:276 start_codon:yes stop_codon:yes gene_type:complete